MDLNTLPDVLYYSSSFFILCFIKYELSFSPIFVRVPWLEMTPYGKTFSNPNKPLFYEENMKREVHWKM